MKFSHRWWVIVALLAVFAVTVSFLFAQTEEPSAVNDPSGAEAQSDSVEAQPSSDEPEQNQLTLGPDRDTAADVETDHLYNELRSRFIDDRAKTVDWWLEATAIFLTLVGVAAAILGYFGFKRLDRIEIEARENVEASEQHAQEAQCYKEEAQRALETIKEEAQRYVEFKEEIKKTLGKIKIDRAVSEAILLQQQNRTDEAIERWHSIATITEETGDERAAEAWFNVGYFKSVKGEDIEAIGAYKKAIDLNLSGPNLPYAYFNRGKIKTRLKQNKSAIDDFDAAIDLDSSYADFYIERGLVKQKSGDSEGAMADLDAVINLNPPDASTHSRVGSLKWLWGSSIDEVRSCYKKALDLAREEGNTDLTAEVESILEDLARRNAP